MNEKDLLRDFNEQYERLINWNNAKPKPLVLDAVWCADGVWRVPEPESDFTHVTSTFKPKWATFKNVAFDDLSQKLDKHIREQIMSEVAKAFRKPPTSCSGS